MSYMLARQIINNGLFVLDIVLMAVIVHHLVREYCALGLRRAYNRLGNQAAFAVLVLMVGHIVIRGWAAALLWHYDRGVNPLEIEERYPVGLAGAALALVGMVCCVRIFSPYRWRNVIWPGSILLAAAFIVAMLVV